MPSLTTKLAVALLVVMTLAGGALRWHRAATPPPRISADQTAYTAIATAIRASHRYGNLKQGDPFHWSPGAPVLFAVADKLGGAPIAAKQKDTLAGRRGEALVGTATILAVAWLGWLLGGWAAALIAAAALAFYPPALPASQVLVSEPVGALTFTLAAACLVMAMRRGPPWWFALAGAAFGVAALCRPDVAPVGALGMLVAGLLARPSWKGRGIVVGLAAAGMILAIAPWTLFASHETKTLVPITRGSNTALMMGTYVPGDGSVVGLKYDQANRVRARYPRLAGVKTWRLPAEQVIDTLIADRRGDRDAKVTAQVHANIRQCLFHRTLRCAEMQIRKLGRMWGGPFTAGQGVSGVSRAWHLVLVLTCWIGLVLVVARTRDKALGVLLLLLVLHTLLNTTYVAEARHAYRSLPLLLAGGFAGWLRLLAPAVAGWRARRVSRAGEGTSPPLRPAPAA